MYRCSMEHWQRALSDGRAGDRLSDVAPLIRSRVANFWFNGREFFRRRDW